MPYPDTEITSIKKSSLKSLDVEILNYVPFTADARQPWTDSRDCYFEYLIIHFDYLIIPFDYLITGQNIAKFLLAVET